MAHASPAPTITKPPQRLGGPALLATMCALVALWPYTHVIAAGSWTAVSLTAILLVCVVGIIARTLLRGIRPVARQCLTLLAQLVTVGSTLTLLLVPHTALLGIIPTPATGAAFARLAAEAANDVYTGTAPLKDAPGIRAVIAVAFAVVAILLDHLISERLAVLTIILASAVGATPMLITFGDPNVIWFIALAIVILLVLRQAHAAEPSTPPPTVAAAIIGIAAVSTAVLVGPAVPVSATFQGPVSSVAVDANLRLGDDLRRPDPVQVLSVATAGGTAPYLRLATLSRFTGDIWRPDLWDTRPVANGFGEPEWSEDLTGEERVTSIRVLTLSSKRLPLPYPATAITGLAGSWEAMLENRTVVNPTSNAQGQDYTVTSAAVTPSREQISASSAGGAPVFAEDLEEVPAIVSELAREVTASAATDYERLLALQSWFRSDFSYSLETPVNEDFDGTGAEAVAAFLQARSGYCVHFAGAFALMAKSLGMPVRIVIGYLPGTLTDEKRGDENVYAVSSDQLHAWPEVHFDGIGWVPFEPTASLGVPTDFASASAGGGSGDAPEVTDQPTSAPSAAGTSAPTTAPAEDPAETPGASTLRSLQALPIVLGAIGVLLLLLVPMALRRVRRARRVSKAHDGDAQAAWEELRDTMLDLGLDPDPAQSPRRRAAELIAKHGVDTAHIGAMVSAIEQKSYAESAESAESGAGLHVSLLRVVRHLESNTPLRTRVGALIAPRSLVAERPSASLVG